MRSGTQSDRGASGSGHRTPIGGGGGAGSDGAARHGSAQGRGRDGGATPRASSDARSPVLSAASPQGQRRGTTSRGSPLTLAPASPVFMPSSRAQTASPLRLERAPPLLSSRSSMLGAGSQPRDIVSTVTRLRSFLHARRHKPSMWSAPPPGTAVVEWRSRERMKTSAVGLVMCLNIGFEPPDVFKASPCARLESWTDPFALPPQKSLEKIGVALQDQYTQWQPRARYKILMDPTVDHVRKLCMSLRRMAKEDRVLFHYNGHGVPRPTSNGEVWMFNPHYTQYVPVSVYDLQTWCGAPAVFVFDCSSAAVLLAHFMETPGDIDTGKPSRRGKPRLTTQHQWIVLAACSDGDTLPLNPDLPADLFTACLTTPIKTALRWLVSSNTLVREQLGGDLDLVDHISGAVTNRRTPLGELNWVLTAITDSIAWNVLDTPLFQRLFRLDLLVSCLFRNFLLADRIMRTYRVTPVSMPALPPASDHPLWGCWDVAAEAVVSALPAMLGRTIPPRMPPAGTDASAALSLGAGAGTLPGTSGGTGSGSRASGHLSGPRMSAGTRGSAGDAAGPRRSGRGARHDGAAGARRAGGAQGPAVALPGSSFFANQLTAFEVWLRFGKETPSGPDQLPIVLQVLLSQPHRHRALALLARFLDLGPWAGNLALAVGIFPYVIKLLQSPDPSLRHILVFVWAKIMALDRTCQNDLVNNNGHLYFISHLAAGPLLTGAPHPPPRVVSTLATSDYIWLCMKTARGDFHRRSRVTGANACPFMGVTEAGPGDMPRTPGDTIPFDQRRQAAFVLCMIMDKHRLGQHCCLQQSLHRTIAAHLHDPSSSVRFWECLCLFKLWENYEDGRLVALHERLPDMLVPMLLTDRSPCVRAGAAVALGGLIRGDDAFAAHDGDDVDFDYGFFAAADPQPPHSHAGAEADGYVTAAWLLALQGATPAAAPSQATTVAHPQRPRMQSESGHPSAAADGVSSSVSPASVFGHGGSMGRAPEPMTTPRVTRAPGTTSPPTRTAPPISFDGLSLPARPASRALYELALCVCAVPACHDCSPIVRREVLLAFARLVVHPRHAAALRIVAAASILHRKSTDAAGGATSAGAPEGVTKGASGSMDGEDDTAEVDVLNAVLAAGATYADLQSLSNGAGNGASTTTTSGAAAGAAHGFTHTTVRPGDSGLGGTAPSSGSKNRRPRAGSEGHIASGASAPGGAANSVRRRDLSNAAIAQAAANDLTAYLRPGRRPRRRHAPSDASSSTARGGMASSVGSSVDEGDRSSVRGGRAPSDAGGDCGASSAADGEGGEASEGPRFAGVAARMRQDDVLLCDVVARLGERGALYLLFWRTLLRMQRDAWPQVSRFARILVLRIRSQLYTRASAPDKAAAGGAATTASSSAASIGGAASDADEPTTTSSSGSVERRHRRRRGPRHAQLASAPGLHTSRSAVDLSRQGEVPASPKRGKPTSTRKTVLATASLQALGLTSTLLESAALRFRQPLLTPAVRAVDLLSKPEVARSGRVRQVERALQAALTLAVTAHPDPDAVLSHAVTACSRQPTPVLQAAAVAPLVGTTMSPRGEPPALGGFLGAGAGAGAGTPAGVHVNLGLGGMTTPRTNGGALPGSGYRSAPDSRLRSAAWGDDDAAGGGGSAGTGFMTPQLSATPRGGGAPGTSMSRTHTMSPMSMSALTRTHTSLPPHMSIAGDGLSDLRLPPTPFSEAGKQEQRRHVMPHKTTLSLVASLSQADVEQAAASQRKLGQKSIFDNESNMTSLLLFHPYETSLVVADDADGLSFWNYEEGRRTRKFSNGGGPAAGASRVTSLQWINEYDDCMLAVGSDDGMVRVWHDNGADSTKQPELVTGFCAMPELVTSAVGPGLVMQWQPGPGHLVAAGNTAAMRVWDLETERCIARCYTPARRSCITSMTHAWPGSSSGLVVAGCSDGAIHILDPRVYYRNDTFDIDTATSAPGPNVATLQPAVRAMTLHEHKNWLVQVAMQRSGSGNAVYSGSISGSIKFWDVRQSYSVKTIKAHQAAMRALVVHDYAPMMASGSKGQHIKLWSTTTGDPMGTLRYHQGFLGQRIGPVSCLCFHRHKMFLAIGATDSIVSIYTGHQ